jgi:5-methylcytosine-specific restriction protein A
MRRTPLNSRYRPTGPLADAIDAVYERAQHSCELCTAAVGPERGSDHHIHHRRPRRAGGSKRPDTNLPSNLLLLCPTCHEVVESRRIAGYENGWILRSEAKPSYVPCTIWNGTREVFLTDDGRYSAEPS